MSESVLSNRFADESAAEVIQPLPRSTHARGLAASCAGLTLVADILLGGCGGSSGGGSTEPYQPTVGGSQSQEVAPANITYGELWSPTGCLEDYQASDDTITAFAWTGLCRAYDTTDSKANNGSFYFYYQRGTGVSDWQKIIGTESDGYTYFTYRDNLWYRTSTDGGGAAQVHTGGSNYEDVDREVVQNPTGITAKQFQEEAADQDAIWNEIITTYGVNPEPADTIQQQTTAIQETISDFDAQMGQYEQNYEIAIGNQAAQNNQQTNQLSNDEEEFLVEENNKLNEGLKATTCEDFDDHRVMDGCS